jgi:prolipoprotein diacylglyceryl transferase
VTTTVLAYIPSPSQGVWYLGVVPIRAYALFIVAGMLAALFIGDLRWEARGGERGVIYSIFWWAMPFGLIGGRLYHVITDWQTYFGDGGAGLAAAFQIWEGGLGIWGAVALGSVGAWIGCRRHGIPLPAFGDAIAPGIVLAQAIGRLGNYFNQELYGRPTTLPWGLEIYERRDASGFIDSLNGVSTGQQIEVVHPTFLYELLWNLLVFAALIYIDRRFKIGHGRLFAMYVAGYCLGRFWIELMRSDAATHIAGIRINSFTATFVFIGAVVYIMVAPKGREDPASLKGKPREVEEEDTSVEEFVKELTGVAAAATGVVAAAKVAGDAEAEELSKAEEFSADVAGVPADDIAEAEQFAAEGEEEPEAESEAAAEAEALAEDVAEAPAEDIAEAEEFAAAGEEAEPVGGVGAVEGEEAVEAEEAAPEAHEAVVDAAEEAEGVAAEVADTSADEEPSPEAEPEESEPVGGVGAVEGEEAVEAEEAAPEAHDAALDAAEEAADGAAEVANTSVDEEPAPEAEPEEPEEAEPKPDEAEADAEAEGEPAEAPSAESEPHEAEEPQAETEETSAAAAEPEVPVDEAETEEVAAESEDLETEDETEEPETEDAEAAVDDADVEPSDEAAEEAEAVIDEAEAAEEEPESEVLESEPEPDVVGEEPRPGQVEETSGRLRRWLRGRRNR